MRFVPTALLAIVAVGFLWLFLTRYWFFRGCIEAASSSCITPDGDNLIEGGMFWIVPAFVFAVLALLRWPRRRR